MAYLSGRSGRALCQFSLAWLAVNCGGKSEDASNLNQLTGGYVAITNSTAQGGEAGGSASGGAQSLGGTSTGVQMSGTTLTGGVGTAGGSPATGGSPSSGGRSSSVGGTPSSGGRSPTGGSVSTGGKPATGGTVNSGGGGTSGVTCGSSVCAPNQFCRCGTTCDFGGGTYACATGGSAGATAQGTGGSPATGGISSHAASGGAGSGGTSATALSDFCQGGESKVSYKGQVVFAPATSYQSLLPLSCCMSYGVNLHTPAFGFDFATELIWYAGGTVAPGIYKMGDPSCATSTCPVRAVTRASTETNVIGHATSGTGELFTEYSTGKPWEFGFCLEVTDSTSDIFGARLYVPKVTIVGWQGGSRLQFFLPSDHSITPYQAAAASTPPALETNAFLDLSDIAYVSESKWEVGLNPGYKLGSNLVTQIGASTLALPFYVKADGVLIYMGSIGTLISEIAPVGPFIFTNTITDNKLVINAQVVGSDSRSDPRILSVLRETSRLIP